jgi:enoyl-CoA hydratase/carnithine racemase
MSVVEIERDGGVMVIRMNRPERMNALGVEMREQLAQGMVRVSRQPRSEVAIFTGTGRAFCAGEDMKEAVARGAAGSAAAPTLRENPYNDGTLDKPVIVAINGFAMGGGFKLVERADLRVAVRDVVFESSEAKRWLLGGYDHGHCGGLPHTVATELAFAFRLTSDRLHELGFLNRLVSAEELLPTAREMAAHLLTLPPASRVNTLVMMRAMRPRVPHELEQFAARLQNHGAKDDLMESRRAFAEKRPPRFKGWDHPDDRHRTPRFESKAK